MAQRRAPDGGYDFAAKRLYRAQIWNLMGRLTVAPKRAHVALMPSLEGEEIEVARQKGFQSSRMHVIDDNPAIVATLKRRFPSITTYGVDVGRAFERMASKGTRIAAANLDLTSCLSGNLLETLCMVGRSGVLQPDAAVSVTVLRGREDKVWMAYADSIVAGMGWPGACPLSCGQEYWKDTDRARIAAIGALLLALPVRAGIYRSGPSTMLWACFRLAHLTLSAAARASIQGHWDIQKAKISVLEGLAKAARLEESDSRRMPLMREQADRLTDLDHLARGYENASESWRA